MKLTEWYPAHIKPVRAGVYEVRTPNNKANKYAYFDSFGWRCCGTTIKNADKQKTELLSLIELSSMRIKNSKWRGLAEKP